MLEVQFAFTHVDPVAVDVDPLVQADRLLPPLELQAAALGEVHLVRVALDLVQAPARPRRLLRLHLPLRRLEL